MFLINLHMLVMVHENKIDVTVEVTICSHTRITKRNDMENKTLALILRAGNCRRRQTLPAQ